MKSFKRFASFLILLLFLTLSGCGKAKEQTADAEQDRAQAPVYGRRITTFQMPEDANPYMTEFSQDGFYYFARGDETYEFFYQAYEGSAVPFCTVTDGIVKGFYGTASDGKNKLAILTVGEEAAILTFDGTGSSCEKVTLDQSLNTPEERMTFIALPEGGFVIGRTENVYLLDEGGQLTRTLKTEGNVNRFLIAKGQDGDTTGAQDIYAVVEQNESGRSERFLVKLNTSKWQAETVRALPEDTMDVLAFEDGFVMISADLVTFFHPDREDDEPLIDLSKQSLLGSQMQYFFGNHEEIKIASFSQEDYAGCLITLSENLLAAGAEQTEEAATPAETAAPEELPLYTEDGRRIVRVAVPEDYIFKVEFHAKKYNQISDKAFVEAIRFEESLETYLGKGNRPDIIVLRDISDVPAYVQKNALVDLAPMFDGQEVCAPDNMLPAIRNILDPKDTGSLYAIPWFFRLLLRPSDGTEYDADGRCDTVGYLQWYDRFMTEKNMNGVGKLEELLYGNTAFFYDEDKAEAYFSSDAFKEMMQAYKEVYAHHSGSRGAFYFADMTDVRQAADWEIAGGPKWLSTYRCMAMAAPDIKMEGIPGTDGENHVYMRVPYPMALMRTSDCKEEAFDFIVYYNSLQMLLQKGDTENAYGKDGGVAYAVFSPYEESMRKNIYEAESPYFYYNTTGEPVECFFGERETSQLESLLDRAVLDSVVQREIYAILTEEMGAYLNGEKSLDAACDVLQNRVTLYLQERKR